MMEVIQKMKVFLKKKLTAFVKELASQYNSIGATRTFTGKMDKVTQSVEELMDLEFLLIVK